jgi:two-component system, LytTR family, response regulator
MRQNAGMRVLIVDDERPARAKLRRLLESETDVDIVGEAASGEAAVDAIRTSRPDVVFLDIQMPVMDGFGVVDAIGLEAMPLVVFATAYDQHAIRAFEVRALDYLLKPFAPERFRAVLARVRAELARADGTRGSAAGRRDRLAAAIDEAGHGARLTRILVHDQGRALFIPVHRIDTLESARNDVLLHTEGRTFSVRGTLSDLVARLDPEAFLRISRSVVVRLDAVSEMEPWFHGDYRVRLRDGRTLTWSRRYRAKGRRAFEV